jgi:hypothetical protein
MLRPLSLAASLMMALATSASPLHGEESQRYRDFQLGADVATVRALAGMEASDVKDVHVRPALIQEFEWRRGYSTAARADSVQQITFTFYNDQLAKLVVDYDRSRTEGLTESDMSDALSKMYGTPLLPAGTIARASSSQIEVESGSPLARWADSEYSATLYRSPYGSAFRLIVIATTLEALARGAEAEAVRMDNREAPQRELARQMKQVADSQASEEKARQANKAAFRP